MNQSPSHSFFPRLRGPRRRNDRLGLVILCASLLVSCLVLVSVIHINRETRQTLYRAEGQRLMRIFPQLPLQSLSDEELFKPCLKAAAGIERDDNFAYLAVLGVDGAVKGAVLRPGGTLPPIQRPHDPVAWFSERTVAAPGGGPDIMEFSAPLFAQGELAGFSVLGFSEPGLGLDGFDWNVFAGLALPVMLLGSFFYLIFRREALPLTLLNQQLQRIAEGRETAPRVKVKESGALQEIVDRLNLLLQTNAERVRELESRQSDQATGEKVLHYRKALLEGVFENLPDGVLVFDDSGTVSFANGKAADLLGHAGEVLQGRGFKAWCEDPKLLAFFSRWLPFRQRPSKALVMEFVPPHLPGRSVAIQARPLVAGGEARSAGTLVVLRDVTEDTLANKARDEFVTHVAHEIKAPLNVLRMYAETLLDERDPSRDFRIEAVNVIHDEVERLGGLINGLLNIARIEMGSLTVERQRVKLHELLKDAFETCRRNGRNQDLTFRLELPEELCPVSLDKDLFRVAINNLLTNAIKYNRPGGSVVLAAEETESEIMIRVRDTGIGIAPEDVTGIFEKFYRSEKDEVRQQPGHGLGLPLAKSIVELHHGKLQVESQPGQGTEFVILLGKSKGLVREAI